MADLVSLVILAVEAVPRVIAGKIIYWIPPIRPEEGNHPSDTEKIKISIIPCQKTGMPTPVSAPIIAILSNQEFGLLAEIIPTGTPTIIAKSTAAPANCAL